MKDIADADLKRFPVENVSWDEARAFVQRLNERTKEAGWMCRLPTEVEWEYACRGGPMAARTESAFDYYLEKPSKSLPREQANTRDSGLRRPARVGSYPPNRLGFYDMHGNVEEWCDDVYDVGPDRAHRGGSWFVGAQLCQAAAREGNAPSSRFPTLGLRLARVATIEEKPKKAGTKKALEAEVQKAVDQGVSFLRKQLPGGGGRPGAQALLGLTLLECGVPANDPDVVKVAPMIRAAVPALNNPYDITPAILFLDRLHKGKVIAAEDRKLIRSLGLRLVAGQRRPMDLWRYQVPVLNAQAEKVLLDQIKDKTFQGPQINDQDISCSQIAALGLWVARRHDVPVDDSLRKAADSVRAQQNAGNGTWNYALAPADGAFKDTATCCGIMLIALGEAATDNRVRGAIFKDAAISKALVHLEGVITKNKGPDALRIDAHGNLYFLWALERTAMILGKNTIGKEDWHAWGSGQMLPLQTRNGSWSQGNGVVPDTCFALLFLVKSNLFQDLTDRLQ